MKRYRGVIYQGEHDVLWQEGNGPELHKLDPRCDLYNHSPSGFCWGYQGSGPAQAALAILADCMGDRVALHHHQDFKRRVIGALAMGQEWTLTEDQVRAYVAELEAERPLHPPIADTCDGCGALLTDCRCA